jgi:hypothetical protein
MNLVTIRSDLAARIATVSGMNAYADVPANPVVPAALVHPATINPQPCLDNISADLDFKVRLMVPLVDYTDAQQAIDAFLSANSVVDAIQAPTTGTESMNVGAIDEYGMLEVPVDGGTKNYASAIIHVNVLV